MCKGNMEENPSCMSYSFLKMAPSTCCEFRLADTHSIMSQVHPSNISANFFFSWLLRALLYIMKWSLFFNTMPASYFSHLHQCIYNGNCNLIMRCIIYLHFSRATYCRVTGRRGGERTRDRKDGAKLIWMSSEGTGIMKELLTSAIRFWQEIRSPCLLG